MAEDRRKADGARRCRRRERRRAVGWHANHRRRVVDRPREPLPTRVQDTPELPPEYTSALEAGLDALSLSLSPESRTAIDGHVRLLLAWTEAINLTGIRE